MRFKKMSLAPFPVVLKLKFTSEELPRNAVGLTTMDGSTVFIVISVANEDKVLPTAVHEAVHAVQFTEDYIEGQLDNETEAYMVSKIATWTMEQYKQFSRQ